MKVEPVINIKKINERVNFLSKMVYKRARVSLAVAAPFPLTRLVRDWTPGRILPVRNSVR